MTTHLLIPDAHCKPGVSNTRFDLLGEFIADKQPDTIICIGDFADMESLCSYDRGKKEFEGRRYENDIAAAHDALRRTNAPTMALNARRRANKKSLYSPRKILTLGNHERRIERAVASSPELEGKMSYRDLRYEEFGWEVIPYTIPIEVDGVWYSHFFPSGIKGEAISGINIASSLLTKMMVSCSVGHCHLLDYATRALPNGQRIHGLSAGCFADLNHIEAYAKNVQYLWWAGLVLKHNVQDGEYDHEIFSMRRLEAMYG